MGNSCRWAATSNAANTARIVSVRIIECLIQVSEMFDHVGSVESPAAVNVYSGFCPENGDVARNTWAFFDIHVEHIDLVAMVL